MTALELYCFLDDRFPKSYACEWDNDGIMCLPDPKKEVKKVLITLDVTPSAIDLAIAKGFDVILSHHPLLFRPISSLDVQNPIGEKLIRLCKNGIAVFSFHTRMDAAPDGVNDALAQAIGLKHVMPLSDFCRIGDLSHPMSVADFSSYISDRLSSACCQYIPGSKKGLISKIVVCGGDGKEFVQSALAVGADAYLTGSLSYNTMMDAVTMPMALITAGHYETEQPICQVLADLLQKQTPDLIIEVFSCMEICQNR